MSGKIIPGSLPVVSRELTPTPKIGESRFPWKKVMVVGLCCLVGVAAVLAPIFLYPAYVALRRPPINQYQETVHELCPVQRFSEESLSVIKFPSDPALVLKEKTRIENKCKELILRNAHEKPSTLPNQQEWESLVAKQTSVHQALIAKVASGQEIEGAHNLGGGSGTIIELPQLPGIIFKMASSMRDQEKYAKDRYLQNIKAQQICEEEGLDRLRVPCVALTELEINHKKVWLIAEEKLPIIGNLYEDFRTHLKLMNSDPQLHPIIDEMMRQLVIFIHRFSLSDLKPNNIPFLGTGVKFALVDLSIQLPPEISIYSLTDPTVLGNYVEARNLDHIQKLVKEIDPTRWKDFNFTEAEQPFRKHLKRLEKQERTLLKRGLLLSSRTPIKEPALDTLSSFEREIAKDFIKNINTRLIKGEFCNEHRAVYIPNWKLKYSDTVKSKKAFSALMDRIIPLLTDNEVIFECNGSPNYGFTVYC
jgi:hypothetical protein